MKRTTSLVKKKSQFKAILVKKLIRKNILWYFVSKIVQTNCENVLVIEITLKFKAENLRSLDQFISKSKRSGQSNFWNRMFFFNLLLEVSQI